MLKDPALFSKRELLAELDAIDLALEQVAAPHETVELEPTRADGLSFARKKDLTRPARILAAVQQAGGVIDLAARDEEHASEVRRLSHALFQARWGADSMVRQLMNALKPIVERTEGDVGVFSLSRDELSRAREIYYEVLELHTAAEEEEATCQEAG